MNNSADGQAIVTEDRYRRFFDEALTANVVIRPDGAIVQCNPAFVNIFGFRSVGDAGAANFFALLRTTKEATELLRLVRENRTIEQHELEMRDRSGEPVFVVARVVGIFDAGNELIELHGYFYNDTTRKLLEQQLIQAQKMEGLGTLAGGIAHDFNNILAIILGYASQLEARNSNPDQVTTAIRVIKDAVERGASLVQQLLASARQSEARLSSVDLNALVRDLEKMLRATFPKMIGFDVRLAPKFPMVTADRSQIHQVLLNLAVNARDAMPNGGIITLETLLVPGKEIAGTFSGADAAHYACIRIGDNGSGMTEEVKEHIFEPFFTTKERAKGTGLGLSVVYGVVNNHRGFVDVQSEVGVGTVFSVYLPVSENAEPAPEDVAPVTDRTNRASQTIMVVEDEEMLRDLAVHILSSEGYNVLTAKDGLEAVDVFAANRDEIGLVICDLGLPRLGGREVFLKMKEAKPSVRAIVASGYLEPTMRSEILKAGVIDTIQKPYDFRELVDKIHSVIGRARSDDDHPQLF
jgi:two-component system, cell cycle sensor histidine kinase and response regulator CckA